MRRPDILVAEDNQVNQLVTRKILEGIGCDVTVVTNGLEAVAGACEHPFDLILMDLHMPEMDGLEATRVIRELATHQPIVIAFTAYVSDQSLVECRAAGMDDFLGKPVRKEELERVIGHWLDVVPARAVCSGQPGMEGHLARMVSDTDETFVREIAGVFVRTGEELVRTATDRWAAGDQVSAVRAIHSLKGAAGNLGAVELMTLCATLEQKGREGTLTSGELREMDLRFAEAVRELSRCVASIPVGAQDQRRSV